MSEYFFLSEICAVMPIEGGILDDDDDDDDDDDGRRCQDGCH
jgi:hypothetical protein